MLHILYVHLYSYDLKLTAHLQANYTPILCIVLVLWLRPSYYIRKMEWLQLDHYNNPSMSLLILWKKQCNLTSHLATWDHPASAKIRET